MLWCSSELSPPPARSLPRGDLSLVLPVGTGWAHRGKPLPLCGACSQVPLKVNPETQATIFSLLSGSLPGPTAGSAPVALLWERDHCALTGDPGCRHPLVCWVITCEGGAVTFKVFAWNRKLEGLGGFYVNSCGGSISWSSRGCPAFPESLDVH